MDIGEDLFSSEGYLLPPDIDLPSLTYGEEPFNMSMPELDRSSPAKTETAIFMDNDEVVQPDKKSRRRHLAKLDERVELLNKRFKTVGSRYVFMC
jgi:predicted alpha/beta superfamily hydrolase